MKLDDDIKRIREDQDFIIKFGMYVIGGTALAQWCLVFYAGYLTLSGN